MGAAGVPLVPGYHGDAQDVDLMMSEADKIGYPILIKPTHGGGGKVCYYSFLFWYHCYDAVITWNFWRSVMVQLSQTHYTHSLMVSI